MYVTLSGRARFPLYTTTASVDGEKHWRSAYREDPARADCSAAWPPSYRNFPCLPALSHAPYGWRQGPDPRRDSHYLVAPLKLPCSGDGSSCEQFDDGINRDATVRDMHRRTCS